MADGKTMEAQPDIDLEPLCPRCHSSMDWEDCWNCEDGWIWLYPLDPLWYDEDEYEECPECRGKGGWWFCIQPEEWCTAEGRRLGTADRPRWREEP